MIKKVFVILMISITVLSCTKDNSKEAPKAVKGVLDLRNWDFEKDGIVKLDGEWEYYWNKFLTKDNFDSLSIRSYINSLNTTDSISWNHKNYYFKGYLTYRLTILLNENVGNTAFLIKHLKASGKIFINNSEKMRIGNLTTNERDALNKQHAMNMLNFYTNDKKFDLILQVSGYKLENPDIRSQSIFLGNSDHILKERDIHYFFRIIIDGMAIVMFIYHLIIYFLRRNEITYLIFSLVCLLIPLLDISTGYNFFNINDVLKLNYSDHFFLFYLTLIINNLYIYKIFPNEINKYTLITYTAILFAGVIVLYVFPTNIFYISNGIIYFITSINMMYCVFVILIAFKRKREGSTVFLIGFIIITILFTGGVFGLTGLFHNIAVGPLLSIIIVLIQSSILAVKFTNSFKKVEAQAIELEKHQHHLEELVEKRTVQLNERNDELELLNNDLAVKSYQISMEKEKSDKLLLNVLPEQIANRLKSGEKNIADHFDEASVIFIDIVDFTKMSAKSTPQKMVNMLNDIFSIFDKISAKYGIEKIKTIGDCYMAAAGIPVPRKDHAQAIALMALDVMETMKGYSYSSDDFNSSDESYLINFRIGLDCGPIVAGVIGEQKFIYDLWGDMVNTASRMETNGVIGKIQCTERFKDKVKEITLIPPFSKGESATEGFIPFPNVESSVLHSLEKEGHGRFLFIERGEIEVKGKGMMRTYFLTQSHESVIIESVYS